MPTRQQIRRRRATALGLIFLSFVLLTAYYGEKAGGALHSIQRGAMEVLSPLQSIASGAIRPARDLVGWVGDSIDAKGENEKLNRELVDARIRLARLQQADVENEQLRATLKFNRSEDFPAGAKPVSARVIVRSPTEWFGRVTINKGSSSGIRENQPAIADGALAGRVTSVSPHAAQITLITDSSSNVAGVVAGRKVLGVVRTSAGGEAGADDLLLAFIRQNVELRTGDMVVTSGTVEEPSKVNSLFPPNIPIGRLTKVDPEERRLYGRVHLKPFVDMRDVQVVEILTKGR